jgi:hypothetical protein
LPLSSFKEGDCEGRLISGFVKIFAVLSLAKKIPTLPQSLPHEGREDFFTHFLENPNTVIHIGLMLSGWYTLFL